MDEDLQSKLVIWNRRESATKRLGIIGALQFQIEVELEQAQEALELFITGLPVTQQQVADTKANIERRLKLLALYKKEVEKIKNHIKEKYRELRQAGASATAQTAADSNGAAAADQPRPSTSSAAERPVAQQPRSTAAQGAIPRTNQSSAAQRAGPSRQPTGRNSNEIPYAIFCKLTGVCLRPGRIANSLFNCPQGFLRQQGYNLRIRGWPITEELIASHQYPDIPLVHQRNDDGSPRFPHLSSFQKHQPRSAVRNCQQEARERAAQSSSRENNSRSQSESRHRHRSPSRPRRRGGYQNRSGSRSGRSSPYNSIAYDDGTNAEQPRQLGIIGSLGSSQGASFLAGQPVQATSAVQPEQSEQTAAAAKEKEEEEALLQEDKKEEVPQGDPVAEVQDDNHPEFMDQ